MTSNYTFVPCFFFVEQLFISNNTVNFAFFTQIYLKDALLQHVKRSIYQAGIWTTSEQSQQALPSPDQFSWKREGSKWIPKWITIPEVSKACSELVRCTCKKACTRCKCVKASLECTPLCKCQCQTIVIS